MFDLAGFERILECPNSLSIVFTCYDDIVKAVQQFSMLRSLVHNKIR